MKAGENGRIVGVVDVERMRRQGSVLLYKRPIEEWGEARERRGKKRKTGC